MTHKGLVLLGHGARDARWKQPMVRVKDLIAQSHPDLPVALAFLEWMEPTLEGAIEQLVAQGVNEVRVVPMFLGQGGHVREDLPRLMAQASQRFSGLRLSAKPAIGEDLGVLMALAKCCTDE